MSAKPAYVLSCEGKPAEIVAAAPPGSAIACGRQYWGPMGCSVEETRRIAANTAGWLTKYGDLCPECVAEQLKED